MLIIFYLLTYLYGRPFPPGSNYYPNNLNLVGMSYVTEKHPFIWLTWKIKDINIKLIKKNGYTAINTI